MQKLLISAATLALLTGGALAQPGEGRHIGKAALAPQVQQQAQQQLQQPQAPQGGGGNRGPRMAQVQMAPPGTPVPTTVPPQDRGGRDTRGGGDRGDRGGDRGGFRGGDRGGQTAPQTRGPVIVAPPDAPVPTTVPQDRRGESRGNDNRGGRGDFRGNDNRGGRGDFRGNDNRGGRGDFRDNDNRGRDFGRSGRERGGFDNRGGSRRDYSGFRGYHQGFRSNRRFHGPSYRRPSGWYARRWTFGEILPALFWSQQYWLTDYNAYDLPPPPYGTVWVRDGNDALLIDRDTGEIISIEYGVFY